MSIDLDLRAENLRTWAAGLLPLEAAVELLTTAVNGGLLNGPWIRTDHDDCGDNHGGGWDCVWFDATRAAIVSGYLSGGERRVLAIAISLAGGDPVDLGDAITGIDHDALRHVLAALARAAGATIETPASHARATDEPRTRPVVGRGTDAALEVHTEDTDETFCSHAEYMVATSTIEDNSETSTSLAEDAIETPAIHDAYTDVSGTASASARPLMSPTIARDGRCRGAGRA